MQKLITLFNILTSQLRQRRASYFFVSLFTFCFFTFAVSLAQESKIAKNDTIQTSNSPNSPQAEQGDVKITDGTNTLIRITDEGTFGAIEILPGTPDDSDNKLYNKNGVLSFSGNPIGVIDNDWTVSGVNMYSKPSGNVGIGTSSPTEKLEVTGKTKTSELQVITGATDGHVLTSDVNGNATWQVNSGGGITYSIGDFAQGGIVFWVDETGQHGLVCAKEDQNDGNTGWWIAGTQGNTQAKGDGPFSGEMNTSIIISAHVAIGDDGSPYSARFCSELEVTEAGKTYGDWYLPAKQELNLMFQNKTIINTVSTANGGTNIQSSRYWSSTEYDFWHAWSQNFNDGNQEFRNKAIGTITRAVRAF